MMRKFKRFLSLTLVCLMVMSSVSVQALELTDPASAVANEKQETLPNATVTKLDPVTLKAGEYQVWNGSLTEGTEDCPLQVVMNFKANDTLEQAQLGGYADWGCDFYLTFDGMESASISGEGSYLAGNYGTHGWIVIPTDGMNVEKGVEYPIVSNYDSNLTYENICDYVKDFTAALHVNPEVLLANPNMTVTLKLKMTNPENAEECLVIGEPAVYTATELYGKQLPEAEVTVLEPLTLAAGEYDVWDGKDLSVGAEERPLQVAMNFKANETLQQAEMGGYGKWICDFYLTFDGMESASVSGEGSYLAGNYGEYGWIVIPTDGMNVEKGVEYPIVSNYDSNLTYENICDYVKDFTAALYVNPETILANPDMTVTLELKMTNPENAEECLVIGEPAVYTATELYGKHLPEAEVTVLDPLTLAAGEYDVWDGSNLTKGAEGRLLQVLMNFKANDTLEQAQLGGYADWICDFYLTFDGMESASISGEGSYLAGNYGEYGWIVIPTDGLAVEKGVEYPIVSNYDPNLTYENICDYVKDFTAALYVDADTLLANPDMTVTLKLKMTNPENDDDYMIIGKPAVYTAGDLLAANGYEAQNINTKKFYEDVNKANDEAAEGETVILLKDVSVKILSIYETFDLNGHTLTATYVTSFGNIVDNSESNAGLLKVSKDRFYAQQSNEQLAVHTSEGYQFVEIITFNYAYLEATQQFVFQPLFEEYAHELLLAGNDVSGVDIQVNVSWVNSKGESRSQAFSYSDASFLEGYINSYKPATGKYGKMFTLKLSNAPTDLSYQARVISDNGITLASGITVVETITEDKTTTENITINTNAEANQASALVPEGTKLAENATADSLKLTVADVEDSQSNITLGENEVQKSVDVHIEGIADDNTVPMIITLTAFAEPGLNEGNLALYHVENGKTNAMTQVFTQAEVNVHNEFYYDPITGDVTMALATFSEVTAVSNTENAWKGTFDYSWYDASKTELVIANADQLAALSAIVGGMDGQNPDSFSGKTVNLVADINLGGSEESSDDSIFYPIGYYNTEWHYKKTNSAITSGFKTFEGTFDGQGHTISNIYQNTWEMKGDHNWYDATLQYYRDGMGLFGKVYGGTVKNLTVKNFSSDGEIATTGVIAAYADCGATFENIAIVNCNPRVYNIGNGGIVGCVGWYANEEVEEKVTFKNITVDNSNKISALWGSYDVACGGIVGQYYPTSGQGTDAELIKNAGIYFENCHVAAQMDVYNDVCANYQYYAYRYAGMMIGSVCENETIDGYVYPKMDGITASGCTVNFGDWNDYYYCELVDNSLASYTHDHQMSRLMQVKAVDDTTITYLDGTNGTVPVSGWANYVVVNGNHGTANATCYHFKDGNVWNHADAGTETVDGVDGVLKEDKQHIYLEFNNLFTGYGWGVTSKGLSDFEGINVDGIEIEEGDQEKSVEKFDRVFKNTGSYLYRVGTLNPVKVSNLFKAKTEGLEINNDGVYVSITDMTDGTRQMGTYTPSTTGNWEDGKIQFTNTGAVKVTIQDYDFCEPTVLYLEVVEAENVTTATAATGKDLVLLNDVTFSGTYLNFRNMTLYGNGFTLDITGADHSDLKDNSDTSSNKSAYCNIWMVDSTFNNVKVVGSVYPEVGMTADSNYGNAAIRTEGNCYIVNSYISNCRVPLRVQGNTTVVDSIVDGGRYANIELRSGNLILDGVTTINTVRKSSDETNDVIGFGIVIHNEAVSTTSISVIGDGLEQYNWVGEIEHGTLLSQNTYLQSAYKLIFHQDNDGRIYFERNNDRYVNTGILCLCSDIEPSAVTGLNDRHCQEVSGYDAWVLTYDNTEDEYDEDWFDERYAKESVEYVPEQYHVLPDYTGANAQTVEFTKGDTYYFDTYVLEAQKFDQSLEISCVTMNETEYNYGDKIPITEGGIYEIVYTVIDPYNYNPDATIKEEAAKHEVSIMVTAIAKDAEILAPKFTFIDQNENEYESTTVKVGDKTYIMPNVTVADPTTNSMNSINIGSVSISGTTVYFPITTGYTVRSGSNFNRYYPLFSGINITDYTIAGDTTGTTYTTSSNYTSLVGSSGTKFIIPANGGQTNCGDYVKTDGQAGNAAGNSDSGWQGAGYNTSYGGTYLKSGNTNASSGADSNGYERIVWVEYCFNAGNGDVYYYRIGYHCEKVAAQTGCFTSDTLITLADGTQKRIDEITFDEQVLAWDFMTGEYVEQDIALLVNHGEDTYRVANLEFSDGTLLRLIADHGVFDYDLNQYVYITVDNMQEYVGHRFVQYDPNGGYQIVTLEKAFETVEITEAYSITSSETMNAFASNILTVAPPADFYNWIPMGDKLRYDVETLSADVEKYGLYDYEVFADYVTYEQFVAWNGPYLKIPVEKGMITFDYILELIELYKPYMKQ